ncbi:hypothetical protein LX81_01078 [Palleronia aestuarii]|uniref:Uncharacterized protein n=1 Tax=Palleronia aestuarii TaxID=568105 RepID=A0A2W7NYU1_9RHOB|nr:hypothetical protein [Palleronia aestuarii]PZX18446.1 hypothetical protein LX81_01078 [Palleronia aestuarii]
MRAILICLALGACGAAPDLSTVPPSGDVSPVAVTLYRDTVTARMSDGTLCTGVRDARSGPWRTAFGGCPHGWPVAVERTAPVPRLPLSPAASDPWVTVTPPGRGPLGFAPEPRNAVPGT